jgi:predicted DsbA family dithiol-disulfide isomerase
MLAGKAFVITCSLAATAGFLAAAGPEGNSPEDVLVEVHGVNVTMADLAQKSAVALFQARTNYYEAERKVIEDAVDQKLLDDQAAKEGLTVAQLLDKHVNNAIAGEPSEEALHVFYEGIDTKDSYEALRGKIVESLRQRRIAKARAAYMDSLRNAGPILIRLAPPRAPISMKDVPVRGDSTARVTILEFADFECPYCQQLQPILDKIETDFKGKINFAFKDFPLPMHPDAPKAAEAAHCAGAQGKYWEYHDVMFDKKALDIASLKSYSSQLGLDTTAFSACLDKGEMAGLVNVQATEANALGLQGTPTVLINGRMINGALNYERIKALIMEELSATDMQDRSPKASIQSSAPPKL